MDPHDYDAEPAATPVEKASPAAPLPAPVAPATTVEVVDVRWPKASVGATGALRCIHDCAFHVKRGSRALRRGMKPTPIVHRVHFKAGEIVDPGHPQYALAKASILFHPANAHLGK